MLQEHEYLDIYTACLASGSGELLKEVKFSTIYTVVCCVIDQQALATEYVLFTFFTYGFNVASFA